MLGENLVVGLHQAPSSTSSWRSLFSHRRTLTRQTSLHPFHATISRSCTRFHSLPPACQNVPRLCLADACMCCRTNLACLLLTVALPHAEGDDSGSLPGRVAATDKARPLTAYTGCLVLASLVPGFCLVFLCAPVCSRVLPGHVVEGLPSRIEDSRTRDQLLITAGAVWPSGSIITGLFPVPLTAKAAAHN
ncbi:hypothetical protein EDB80DRAFT_273972 [Ilyonectria destructans]|nr:hypothetical protein EDB80DRAFT_273972 [Ilyonectria destructans]